MKKLFSLFVVVLCATMVLNAADPIILTPAGQTEAKGDNLTVTIDGITLEWGGALYDNDKSGHDFRIYAGKSMKISAESTITKIVIAGFCKKEFSLTTTAGNITTGAAYEVETTKKTLEDPLVVIEEIDATELTITAAKQIQCQQIAVYLSEETGLNNVELNTTKATKIVENGQVYILREGVKYNIFGAVVNE